MSRFRRPASVTLALAALLAAPLSLRAQETAEKTPPSPAPSPEATQKDQWTAMRFGARRMVVDAMAGETLERLMILRPKAKELFASSYGYAVFDCFKFGIGLSGSRARRTPPGGRLPVLG